MAEGIKISQLGAVGAVIGNEPIPLVQNGVTSSVTPNVLKNFITAGGGGGGGGISGIIDVSQSPYNADKTGAVDCTAVANTAIQAGITTGSVVYFPPGTYKVTMTNGVGPNQGHALLVNGPCTISAHGATFLATVNLSLNQTALLYIVGSNVTIDGGTWDFNAANGGQSATNCWVFQTENVGGPFSNITLKNLIEKNCPYGGASMSDMDSLTVSNTQWSGNYGGDCLIFANGRQVNHLFLRDNYFEVTALTNNSSFNLICNSTFSIVDFEITGNHFYGATPPGSVSGEATLVQLFNGGGPSAGLPTNGVIGNNGFWNGNYQLSAAEMQNVAVNNNYFFGGHSYAIEASGAQNVYSNNAIDGNGTLLNGIVTTGGTMHTINGNVILNTTFVGIQAETGDSVISGNYISTVTNGLAAIWCGGFGNVPTGLVVSNNLINFGATTGGNGIYMQEAYDCVVNGNNILGSGSVAAGITFVASAGTTRDYITCKDNQVQASTSFPMAFSGTHFGTNINVDPIGPGFGYMTGVLIGGAATQTTSKVTGVTLNALAGQITLNNAALGPSSTVSFTLSDSYIASTDLLAINHVSGGTIGSYAFNAAAGTGNAAIYCRNLGATTLSEALTIGYAVIKSTIN